MSANSSDRDNGNDIVISGISGRYPKSSTVDEFAANLFAGIDMITESDHRWPLGIYNSIYRMGQLKDTNKFDITFFGLMDELVVELQADERMVLEVTYEAIMDSGINPEELRGSCRTGVYVGRTIYYYIDCPQEEVQPDICSNMDALVINNRTSMNTLYANRISYVFSFKGPSIVMDTACSSSLTALNVAINDLKLGNIDYALVSGCNMNNMPQMVQIYQETGLVSARGVSAPFDESADGFVKAEAVVCLLLQRRSTARRVYARVLSAGINNDGKKTMGMFCPSSEAHEELMVNTYTKAGVDPLEMTYIDGHITGTNAGDPQEVKSIYKAYCERPGRSVPLPVGSVKGNMGHSEGASGLTSLTKVLIAYENECIPPNRNLKHLKHELKQYCPPLMPITEQLSYNPGLAAINNFGIGGVNCHVIVEPNYKVTASDSHDICDTIPRLVTICGRNEDAVKYIMNFIEMNPKKVTKDFLALLCESMKYTPNINSSGFPYRGSMIIKKTDENNNELNNEYNYIKRISYVNDKTLRPFWLVFPGLGGQWPAMAKALMPIKTFASKVEECHQILQEFGIDLKHLLLSEDKTSMTTMTAKFCSTTALQIALYEVIKGLDITPDGIIGHSFGEIACAYADGCLSTRDAMIVTYFRGYITESDQQIPRGLMAVVGLSKAEALNVVSNGVYVVCNNAKDFVVISGPMTEMTQTMDLLDTKGVFVRQLLSSDIPYHSQYLRSSAQPMIDAIKQHIPNPRLRSRKWVSTAILTAEPNNELLGYASAEYFVYNLMNPVHFYDRLKQIPQNAVMLEISPNNIFSKILTESVTNSSYLSLITEDSNHKNLDQFLTTVAKLYEFGYNPSVESLYPRVDWPVARGTPSISSLVRWDHSHDFTPTFRKWPQNMSRSVAADMNVTLNVKTKKDSYLLDHVSDGINLFPATGYLMLVWRQAATYYHTFWNQLPVVFENVQFLRATFLSPDKPTRLTVQYFKRTGEFSVLENDNICAVGNVRVGDDSMLTSQQRIREVDTNDGQPVTECQYVLDRPDIYKEMHIIGYEYGKEFQSLLKLQTQDFGQVLGRIEWTGNMVTFLDGLLQSQLLMCPFRRLMIPVMISSIKIDPKVLFEALKRNRVLMDDKDDSNGTTDSKTQKIQEKYCIFSSQLPLVYDSETKLIVTHGVEMQNMTTTALPIKLDTNHMVLEKYQFIPNNHIIAIEPYLQKQLHKYIEVCKALAVRLRLNGFNEMKCDFNYQNISDTLIQSYRTANTANHVLFKILDKIYSLKSDSKNINNLLNEIQTNPEYNINQDLVYQVSSNDQFLRSLVEMIGENILPVKVMKICEINLTGSLLIQDIERYLTYSQFFWSEVECKLVVKSKQSVTDPKLRDYAIEWDVKESFVLKLNHLIVLRDSQELWELDLKDLVQDLYASIENNGFLLTIFRYKFTEPELALNSLFGITVNNLHLDKRINDFINQANDMGLRLICSKCDTIASKALLFRKQQDMPTLPAADNIITISGKCEQWFDTLKNKLLMAKDLGNNSPKVWLIANDSCINGIMGLWKSLRQEPGGKHFRYIFVYNNNYNNNDNKLKVDFNVKPFSDILANDLTANVIKEERVGTYRYIKFAQNYDKTLSNDYYLRLGKTSDLSSLEWTDATNQVPDNQFYDLINVQRKLIPVKIYSSGLIFKDIMIAMGRVPAYSQYFDIQIGHEFAGRRADTGERVMGFNVGQCFATKIHLAEYLLTIIPSHWSMNESITILSTYFTVWYGLIARAQMRKGESVLIHSAAGGVGQAAINVCQHYGCDIYVTVGSEDKKQFLMNTYSIPANRIFSSRNTEFHDQIMVQTKGNGIDLVLNSLTGDKLDASYECVGKGGRFVELGKYDLIQNKKLGMFNLLKDIVFIAVSLDQIIAEKYYVVNEFYQWMHQNSTNGCVKPLNLTVFIAQEVKRAFRHMTTGKHIGKIVISIRDEEDNRKAMKIVKYAPNLLVTIKNYFNPNNVYIIVGGLGGFGLELTQWMMNNGAKRFVLTSRSGIKSNYQKYIVNRMIEFGKKVKHFETQVVVSTEDCFTEESAKRLLSEAKKLGPIGGVFQLALELNNHLVEDLSYELFIKTVDIKEKVCRNLDQMTRQMVTSLDYFVIFSSVTSAYGTEGQTNYTYGNSITERVCEQRQRDGLKGLAIQWGPIGNVGAMSNITKTMALITMQKQRINSCCDILNKVLTISDPIVTVNVKARKGNIKKDTSSKGSKSFITNLWSSLGIDPQTTPAHLTLGEIGIESMFAAELQQEFGKISGQSVAIDMIKGMSVGLLKHFESGGDNHITDYFKRINRSQIMLSKYKFVFPSETHVRLNSVKNGKPLYVMPPLEVDFAQYDQLANTIDRPVIGLNWTASVDQLLSLKDVMKYFIDLMAKLEPNGSYDVLGVMDGAIICNKLLRKGRADVAVIIDVLNKECYRDNELSDNCIIDLVYNCLSYDIPDNIKTCGTNDNDLNARLKKMSAIIRDFMGKSMTSQNLDQILKTMVRRIQWFYTYRSTKQQKYGNDLKSRLQNKWRSISDTNKRVVVLMSDKFVANDDINCLYLMSDSNDMSTNITIDCLDTTDDTIHVTNATVIDKLTKII